MAGATVAVLAGAIGIGLAVAGSKPDTEPALSSTGAVSTSPNPSTPTPTPTARVRDLPRSRPLTATQLVVPMKVNGNWDVYLADTGKAAPGKRLTRSSTWDTLPSLSPDRASVVYVRRSEKGNFQYLRVVAPDGKGDRPLFKRQPDECAGGTSRPGWNPLDPTMLAASRIDQKGHQSFYLLNTDGKILRQIDLGQTGAVGDPAFSPDGKTVAFWVAPDDQYDGGTLMTAPVDGTATAVRLVATTMAGQDADPAWSPDGTSIAFRRRAGTADDRRDLNIWRVDIILRSAPQQLTTSDVSEQDPSWSPGGDQIAFKSARQTSGSKKVTQSIWVMARDGSGQRPLFTAGSVGEQTAAAWSRR